MVLAIYEDSSGTLWIGTDEGFYRFDRQAERFDRLPHNPPDPGDVKRETIRSIAQDQSGVPWLGTHGRGLSEFDPATGAFTYHQHGWDPDTGAQEQHPLSSNFVRDVIEDASGRLWVGTQDGLNSYASTRDDERLTTARGCASDDDHQLKPPKLFAWLASVVAISLIIVTQFLARGDDPYLRGTGVFVLLLASVFIFAPFYLLTKHGQTYMQARIVVDRGLYAITHHPQYLGYILLA
jgi:hypothetical protein